MTLPHRIEAAEEAGSCGTCEHFLWNGTRYGGVCNGIASSLFNRTLSCLHDACGAHSALRAKESSDGE